MLPESLNQSVKTYLYSAISRKQIGGTEWIEGAE